MSFVQAIINKLITDSYFSSIVRTRTTERNGSWYENLTPETLVAALLGASWETYNHASIKEPAQGFRANIPGKLGIVEISRLPADAILHLTDPKGTGKVHPSISAAAYNLSAPDVGFTTMIVGPHEGESIVYTFHPGDPIRPSELEGKDGTITAAEASKLGFDYAKLIE